MEKRRYSYYFSKYLYAGIVALITIVALIIGPMFDPNGSIRLEVPTSAFGWISYIVIRAIAGVMSYTMFICFDNQGKVNILENEKYLTAYKKLYELEDKSYIPVSPQRYLVKTRLVKGLTLFITTFILAFVLIEAIVQYNYQLLLTYVVTLVTGIISGLFQMNKAETYWTEEFPLWVEYKVKENKNDTNRQENI